MNEPGDSYSFVVNLGTRRDLLRLDSDVNSSASTCLHRPSSIHVSSARLGRVLGAHHRTRILRHDPRRRRLLFHPSPRRHIPRSSPHTQAPPLPLWWFHRCSDAFNQSPIALRPQSYHIHLSFQPHHWPSHLCPPIHPRRPPHRLSFHIRPTNNLPVERLHPLTATINKQFSPLPETHPPRLRLYFLPLRLPSLPLRPCTWRPRLLSRYFRRRHHQVLQYPQSPRARPCRSLADSRRGPSHRRTHHFRWLDCQLERTQRDQRTQRLGHRPVSTPASRSSPESRSISPASSDNLKSTVDRRDAVRVAGRHGPVE